MHLMQMATELALLRRWTALLSVATLPAWADTLFGTAQNTDQWEATAPLQLGALLGGEPYMPEPTSATQVQPWKRSRLPARK